MWIKTSKELPPEGVKVATKIDDGIGERNLQVLVRKGKLWFYPDMSMYVYYTPTHWNAEGEYKLSLSACMEFNNIVEHINGKE